MKILRIFLALCSGAGLFGGMLVLAVVFELLSLEHEHNFIYYNLLMLAGVCFLQSIAASFMSRALRE